MACSGSSYSEDNDDRESLLPCGATNPLVNARTTEKIDQKRHLGLESTALLLINRMIGAAIFSIPSSIVRNVGSTGATLSLWLVGFALAYCGMFVWLELGCRMPHSGGEKLYLEQAYPRPARLTTTLYAFYVLFSFGGLTSVVVVDNLLLALNVSAGDAGKRTLSMGVLVLIAVLYISSRTWSMRIMNSLGLIKIVILVLVILTGIAAVCGLLPSVPDPGRSFQHPFAGSSTDDYAYTVALFKILATFNGCHNAAYVLDEVKDPQRTLKLSGILGVGAVGVLYLLANVCYVFVATPEEISHAGVQVVAILLGKVFGSGIRQTTAALTALSSFASLMTIAFAFSRVVQRLAWEGAIPAGQYICQANILWNTLYRVLPHVLFYSGSHQYSDAYIFLVDLSQYEVAMIRFFVAIGLFRLRRKSLVTRHQFRVWTVVPYIFLTCQLYLLLSPSLAPEEGGTDASLP
ncbi:amino acid/polyamine transporter I [Aspergillus pseudocaelatus]|uniref:Amino acid/polyamine transporter I n=1 Tax=Aspergillus pseudocaelatus TaxID=1825620 RepID=A0ABQ6WU39_9EURO|nr:amino acid/polyamine transporter I [Aspergillus pseudocaelatus]